MMYELIILGFYYFEIFFMFLKILVDFFIFICIDWYMIDNFFECILVLVV